MDEIINKVSQSTLQTIDLEEWINKQTPRAYIDIHDYLYEGFILREKDIRDFVKNEDWEKYKGKYVAIHCSSDSIIPTWAYMLIGSRLSGIAKKIVFGNDDKITEELFNEAIDQIDLTQYRDAKVVIKGCSDYKIPESCYLTITEKLAPIVSSIMYGEPCSTVPILKNRGKKTTQ